MTQVNDVNVVDVFRDSFVLGFGSFPPDDGFFASPDVKPKEHAVETETFPEDLVSDPGWAENAISPCVYESKMPFGSYFFHSAPKIVPVNFDELREGNGIVFGDWMDAKIKDGIAEDEMFATNRVEASPKSRFNRRLSKSADNSWKRQSGKAGQWARHPHRTRFDEKKCLERFAEEQGMVEMDEIRRNLTLELDRLVGAGGIEAARQRTLIMRSLSRL